MDINLQTAANICCTAGRLTVSDAIKARGRHSPWEVSEAWLKIAMLQALFRFSTSDDNKPFRIFDELIVRDIMNITLKDEVYNKHPIDIAVLSPLKSNELGQCYPWAQENMVAHGLIEIKKNFSPKCVTDDAQFLRLITESCDPTLRWVLQVVFINGSSNVVVNKRADDVAESVREYGLIRLTDCQPLEALPKSDAIIKDCWYNIVCFGHSMEAVT